MNAALLLTALFNGAWQGTVLCTAAYLVLRTQRRLNATTMFAVWTVLLAIALALPAANYVFATRPYTVHVSAVADRTAQRTVTTHEIAREHVRVASHEPAAAPVRPSFAQLLTGAFAWLLDRAPVVLFVVLGIAVFRLSVLARDLVGMFAARRAARRIELPVCPRGSIRRPYAFAASKDLTSPCVLGFSPALIVIPEELLGAPERELLSVVLHEREHVRRYDDVQNVIHRFIAAIAFFCPGVRIALRELALYREQICDDAAVNGTGDAVSYAIILTGMAQWAQGRGVPVPSLIFKRKQLLHRLEMLLDGAVNHSLRMNRRFALVAATAVVFAAAIVLHVQVPVIAKAIAPVPAVAPVKPVHAYAAPKPVKHAPVKPAVAKPAPAPAPTAKPKPVIAPKAPHAAHPEPALAPQTLRFSPPPARIVQAPAVVAYAPTPQATRSGDLMDALESAGIRNLTVDQLIAIRDHGVSSSLVRAAVDYFGPGVSADALVSMADHGVSASYLESLRSNGVRGIAPASVILLMDRGVNASLIRAANSYFSPAPAAADLAMLSDHGVSASYIGSLRSAGALGVRMADVVRLRDHGVDASYIVKVRHFNSRASIDDIIRLRDSGF